MSSLKSIRLPASANLKLLLVVLAFAIVAGTLWFTQQLVNDLRQAERKTIELYGKTLQELINDENADPSSTPALNLAVDLVTTIEFPMMLTEQILTGDEQFDIFCRSVDQLGIHRDIARDIVKPDIAAIAQP